NFALVGGWTLAATDDASSAIINAHVAACVAALVWLLLERLRSGKVTATGFASGLVAGIAGIAPAAGLVSPGGAILIGALVAPVCYFALRFVRKTLAIDDSSVFALHGVGGLVGALLVAVFMGAGFGGTGYPEGGGLVSQLIAQIIGLGAVAIWSILGTLIIGYGVAVAIPMRVSPDAELRGLDVTSHGEQAWAALAQPAPQPHAQPVVIDDTPEAR
ncbi:ammonium transporter, partial [Blastomonas sp.]|uniref:ammonium transporter n=1 Tax=Blastomonas sp. TaxID=1909299 RepID=UPI00359328B7